MSKSIYEILKIGVENSNGRVYREIINLPKEVPIFLDLKYTEMFLDESSDSNNEDFVKHASIGNARLFLRDEIVVASIDDDAINRKINNVFHNTKYIGFLTPMSCGLQVDGEVYSTDIECLYLSTSNTYADLDNLIYCGIINEKEARELQIE